jgi:hypothetical protein
MRADSIMVMVRRAAIKERIVHMTVRECMEDKAAAKNVVR